MLSIVEGKSGSQSAAYWEAVSSTIGEKSASQCRHRYASLSTKVRGPTVELKWTQERVVGQYCCALLINTIDREVG